MRQTVASLLVLLVLTSAYAQCEAPRFSLPTTDLSGDEPTPAPVPVVDLEGPSVVPSGGFVIVFAAPDEAKLTWRNLYPDGAAPPFSAVDERNRKLLVFVNSVPGIYRFRLTAQLPVAGLDPIAEDEWTVTVGGNPPPPPTPVPPLPPNPILEGRRRVVLLYETETQTPALGRTLVLLRSGPSADYLKSQGHELEILDQDARDETGKPSEYVMRWRSLLAGMSLPAVVVADAVTDTVLAKKSFDDRVTDAAILDFVKANGG